MQLAERIESITDKQIKQQNRLSSSLTGMVWLIKLTDHTQLVAKTASSAEDMLAREGFMLRYLREHSELPVPDVLYSDVFLLLMTYIDGRGGMGSAAQRHAAELLSALHSNHAPHYGLEQDTLIGALHQPNPQTERWIDFFRDHRLLYMAKIAYDAGQLPGELRQQVERLSGKLDQYLDEPEAPTLLHGDIWSGNVIAANNQIAGFIDPAVYYGHSEIELAFITLFNTFGDVFFKRYHEIKPIQPGFFEERRDIYNLYPLLVHVRLFGGGYVNSVRRILGRFGA